MSSPKYSEDAGLTYGKLSELIIDDPIQSRSEYYFISITGDKYSLSEENYFSLYSQADKNGFIYIDTSSLKTDNKVIELDSNKDGSIQLAPRVYFKSLSNTGEQKVIVILIAEQNQTNQTAPTPLPISAYNSLISNEFNNYIKENSFNQT